MRINVYSQELSAEVKVVSAADRETGVVHQGVRMYLRSPDCLHHTPSDDDRSAITFWIPSGENFSPLWLAKIFERMSSCIRSIGIQEIQNVGPAE